MANLYQPWPTNVTPDLPYLPHPSGQPTQQGHLFPLNIFLFSSIFFCHFQLILATDILPQFQLLIVTMCKFLNPISDHACFMMLVLCLYCVETQLF